MIRLIPKRFWPRNGGAGAKGDSFNKNVSILAFGTSIAQLIPLLISPILTRIYSPEDFGVLMLFLSVSMIVGSVATLRYELAIALPETHQNSLVVATIAALLTVVTSLVSFVLLYFFRQEIGEILGGPSIGNWLLMAPIAILLAGMFNVLNYLSLRHSEFKPIATAGVSRAVVTAVSQVGSGFLFHSPVGLIIGQIFGSIAACGVLFKKCRKFGAEYSVPKVSNMWQVAKDYRDFPKFSVWAALANTASTHAVNLIISVYFTVASLGFYSLVVRVLGSPTALIGQSIGQVFFQEASDARRQGAEVLSLFMSTFYKLLVVCVVPFSILYFIAEDLFAFVFGENWRVAGELTKIMIPAFAVRFVVSPLSSINAVHQENKLGMYFNLLLLLMSAGVIVLAASFGLEFRESLVLLSGSLATFYALYFFVLRSRTKFNDARVGGIDID